MQVAARYLSQEDLYTRTNLIQFNKLNVYALYIRIAWYNCVAYKMVMFSKYRIPHSHGSHVNTSYRPFLCTYISGQCTDVMRSVVSAAGQPADGSVDVHMVQKPPSLSMAQTPVMKTHSMVQISSLLKLFTRSAP